MKVLLQVGFSTYEGGMSRTRDGLDSTSSIEISILNFNVFGMLAILDGHIAIISTPVSRDFINKCLLFVLALHPYSLVTVAHKCIFLFFPHITEC